MDKGYGADDQDAMEHARYHGREDGHKAAQEWIAALSAGTASREDVPEAEPVWVIAMADGSDLLEHCLRPENYGEDGNPEDGMLDIPECYADAYNEAVRFAAGRAGITLPPGTAPCVGWHELVGPDLETETVTCERCGYTEDADPDDVAEQVRLLAEIDAGGE